MVKIEIHLFFIFREEKTDLRYPQAFWQGSGRSCLHIEGVYIVINQCTRGKADWILCSSVSLTLSKSCTVFNFDLHLHLHLWLLTPVTTLNLELHIGKLTFTPVLRTFTYTVQNTS
jgi:hypothetical protein